MCWVLRIFILLQCCLLSTAQTSSSVINDYAEAICQRKITGPNGEHVSTMDALVGGGWDNLRNVQRSPVLLTTFKQCRTTNDGLYLIPDGFEVVVVKRVHLDRTAQFYAHFDDYLKATSLSINADASASVSLFKVSGTFSTDYAYSKRKFESEKTSQFRTSLKYHAYTVLADFGSNNLHPDFASALLSIDENLRQNLTRKAVYGAQMLIAIWGTHMIREVIVGATIEQADFIDANTQFTDSSSLFRMKYASSASFLVGALGLGASVSYGISLTDQEKEQFSRMVRHSEVRSAGGPRVNELISATAPMPNQTQAVLPVDELVALDRFGTPLYKLVNRRTLPSVSPGNLDVIVELIRNATEEYYKRNTIQGCMVRSAPNYNYQANLNDSTCMQPYNNFTFGGIFQSCIGLDGSSAWRCEDSKLNQPNGATGSMSCPIHYEPVQMLSRVHQFPDRYVSESRKRCHSCYLVATCCDHWTAQVLYQDKVRLNSYWCGAIPNITIGENEGYMFGGLYSDKQANPFTGTNKCPGYYVPYRLGFDISVCLSRDYQLGLPFSIPFGGFFSCETPVAEAKCPHGYSQHLATIMDSCELYYCIVPESFSIESSPEIKLPPYEEDSLASMTENENTVFVYLNDTFLRKDPLHFVLAEAARINQKSGLVSNSVSAAVGIWMESLEVPMERLQNGSSSDNHDNTTPPSSTASGSSGLSLPMLLLIAVVVSMAAVFVGLAIRKIKRRSPSTPSVDNPLHELPYQGGYPSLVQT